MIPTMGMKLKQHWVGRYGVAVLATALTTGLTVLLQPYLRNGVMALFFGSVMFSSWFGGLEPVLVASGLSVLAALGLVTFSLLIGITGYRSLEHLSTLDAFLESAMLLGGMGSVHEMRTPEGKFFAGCYALYAGLVFIVGAGVILAPMVHRVLHRLHWEEED